LLDLEDKKPDTVGMLAPIVATKESTLKTTRFI
jgi:hypothetical protein